MPLQNRVLPTGEIVISAARGTLMGNRGGRIHNANQKLGRSRWRSKAWIACVLQFKGRARRVMGDSYTELFFLDEATALAAGHRPCFECRRADAMAFKTAWAKGSDGPPPSAPQMDEKLHRERWAVVGNGRNEIHRTNELPNGTMIEFESDVWTVLDGEHYRWTAFGYDRKSTIKSCVTAITPPAIIETLRNGYVAELHPSIAAL